MDQIGKKVIIFGLVVNEDNKKSKKEKEKDTQIWLTIIFVEKPK